MSNNLERFKGELAKLDKLGVDMYNDLIFQVMKKRGKGTLEEAESWLPPASLRLAARKAPGDWRTPRRFARFASRPLTLCVLDCGGPPPLFFRRATAFKFLATAHRPAP